MATQKGRIKTAADVEAALKREPTKTEKRVAKINKHFHWLQRHPDHSTLKAKKHWRKLSKLAKKVYG